MFPAARVARVLSRLYPRRVVARVAAAAPPPGFDPAAIRAKYRDDPVGFCADVLGVDLTPDQRVIAAAIATRKVKRVKVNSGHGIGKTLLAACLVLWWVYTRDPGVVITTAPTERDVIDLLWTEVRLRWRRALIPLPDYFIGPSAPEMHDHEEHWAKGYTARDSIGFQGRHRPSMLFVFDESEGVPPDYWKTTNTMFQPDGDHAWLAIGNPTTTSSQSYLEDNATAPGGGPKWDLYRLSALTHPNVAAQLAGRPPPIPDAVTLGQVEQWVQDWTARVPPDDAIKEGDIEWPPRRPCPACSTTDGGDDVLHQAGRAEYPGRVRGPGGPGPAAGGADGGGDSGGPRDGAGVPGVGGPDESGAGGGCPVCGGARAVGGGTWVRPGPNFKSRVLGIRPTEGVDTVWSGQAFDEACKPRWAPEDCWARGYGVTVSVDPAAFGDDDTAIHVRCGPLSLHHESHNGWGPDETARRVKQLCVFYADWYNARATMPRPPISHKDVLVVIEFDGGYGVGVWSHAGPGWPRWRGATAGSASQLYDPLGRPMYCNLRSELWGESARLALGGQMDLSRLPPEVLARLRVQLTAPYYEVVPGRGRMVEQKKYTKERLGRSPDDADALILCHYTPPDRAASAVLTADHEMPGSRATAGRPRR